MTRLTWTYYVTRDSEHGVLAPLCDAWGLRPRRVEQDGCVKWVPAEGAYGGHLGLHDNNTLRHNHLTPAETDRELVIAEQWRDDGGRKSPTTKKPMNRFK